MKKVVVLGGGESGTGAALLASKLGYNVLVSDYGTIAESYKQELRNNKILFEERGHRFENLEIEFVIKSPGVPDAAPIVEQLRSQSVPIISEIEFGSRHYSGKVLAVTGSNGKTTTSGLLCHFLKTAQFDVALGGNYGTSFARILTERTPEYMVLEVSSFQLDDVDSFRPDIAILLNISPDHLDRYDYDVRKYARAKLAIAKYQEKSDVFIYNADDPLIMEIMAEYDMQQELIPVSQASYINGITSTEDSSVFEMTLKGKHNLFNAYCAVTAARLIGLTEEQLATGLKTFVNDPHRMERVAVIDGVEYINDSKATNVDAVYYALDAMQKPIIWIAGGTDKGNDYNMLLDLTREKVKGLICLGIDNEKLKQSFKDVVDDITETQDINQAVSIAREWATTGDVVLLSPACASFDLFKNYKDRGDQFKKAVLQIRN